jgi:hypothetical protein
MGMLLDTVSLSTRNITVAVPAEEDVVAANAFWHRWGAILQHGLPYSMNPLLCDARCFADFVLSVRVGRSIRGGRRDELRLFLLSNEFPLDAVLNDKSGASIDAQDRRLCSRFGTIGFNSSIKSVLSKIMSVIKPETFVEYDTKIRRGLEFLSGGRSVVEYSSFLSIFNDIFSTAQNEIAQVCAASCAPESYSGNPGFQRKVLACGFSRLGTPRPHSADRASIFRVPRREYS